MSNEQQMREYEEFNRLMQMMYNLSRSYGGDYQKQYEAIKKVAGDSLGYYGYGGTPQMRNVMADMIAQARLNGLIPDNERGYSNRYYPYDKQIQPESFRGSDLPKIQTLVTGRAYTGNPTGYNEYAIPDDRRPNRAMYGAKEMYPYALDELHGQYIDPRYIYNRAGEESYYENMGRKGQSTIGETYKFNNEVQQQLNKVKPLIDYLNNAGINYRVEM